MDLQTVPWVPWTDGRAGIPFNRLAHGQREIVHYMFVNYYQSKNGV